jgi:hypothetical protein
MCAVSNKSANADLVCTLNWKDGLFLLLSYTVVKLLSPLLAFDTIFKRILLTITLYSFLFGLISFSFWLASFFQAFFANTFFHMLLIIVIVESIFMEKKEERVDMRTTESFQNGS